MYPSQTLIQITYQYIWEQPGINDILKLLIGVF